MQDKAEKWCEGVGHWDWDLQEGKSRLTSRPPCPAPRSDGVVGFDMLVLWGVESRENVTVGGHVHAASNQQCTGALAIVSAGHHPGHGCPGP